MSPCFLISVLLWTACCVQLAATEDSRIGLLNRLVRKQVEMLSTKKSTDLEQKNMIVPFKQPQIISQKLNTNDKTNSIELSIQTPDSDQSETINVQVPAHYQLVEATIVQRPDSHQDAEGLTIDHVINDTDSTEDTVPAHHKFVMAYLTARENGRKISSELTQQFEVINFLLENFLDIEKKALLKINLMKAMLMEKKEEMSTLEMNLLELFYTTGRRGTDCEVAVKRNDSSRKRTVLEENDPPIKFLHLLRINETFEARINKFQLFLPLNRATLLNVSDTNLQILRIDDAVHTNSTATNAPLDPDFTVLKRRFPKLQFIEIRGGRYNCSYFSKTVGMLKRIGVTLFLTKTGNLGNRGSTGNVYGLFCTTDEILDQRTGDVVVFVVVMATLICLTMSLYRDKMLKAFIRYKKEFLKV